MFPPLSHAVILQLSCIEMSTMFLQWICYGRPALESIQYIARSIYRSAVSLISWLQKQHNLNIFYCYATGATLLKVPWCCS